jgi:glycosyltransferase involved in cell wall biosynthesis
MRKVNKNVRMLYALTTPAKQYFQQSLNLPANNISVQTMGVDLNVFRPLSMNAARVELNLPSTGHLLLYTGQFNSFKGLPQIINAVDRLKRKFDVDLVVVGGKNSDNLYQYLKKKVRYVYPWLNHSRMLQFYTATDALTYFWKNNLWGGPSVSVMEAMACNRGVVSNTLQFSPIPESPENGCYIPRTVENIEQKLTDFLNNSSQVKTRNIAQKYFSWDIISKKTLAQYGLCD